MAQTSQLGSGLAGLTELGFERVDVESASTQVIPMDGHRCKVIATRPAMGTLVSLTVVARSQHRAEDAIGRAFQEMDRLIAIFNRYDAASAVSQLNDAGRLDKPPTELVRVVSQAQKYHDLSRGVFDISVAPLVDLFGNNAGGGPSRSEISDVLELVGAQHIGVSRRRIQLDRSGMRVTTDGIAKGHIVDGVARVLERRGIREYLVEAGGDIRVSGTKSRPWTVAVQDPHRSGRFPDTIRLTAGAIATSGGYERYYDPGRNFHHIVDSKSGSSPQHSDSVSVIAPNAMAADALATVVFLMESSSGIAFVEALSGCECLAILRDGTQVKTTGWSRLAQRP
jgi:thiamine biosynthesis lipoprotein